MTKWIFQNPSSPFCLWTQGHLCLTSSLDASGSSFCPWSQSHHGPERRDHLQTGHLEVIYWLIKLWNLLTHFHHSTHAFHHAIGHVVELFMNLVVMMHHHLVKWWARGPLCHLPIFVTTTIEVYCLRLSITILITSVSNLIVIVVASSKCEWSSSWLQGHLNK